MNYRVGLLFLCSMWADAALSQACCTATGSNEFAVVGRCQQGVIASQLSFERAFGSHNRDGEYRPLGRGHVQDFVMNVGAGFRLFDPRLQISGVIPIRVQQRHFGMNNKAQSVGVGDTVLSLRFTALQDSMLGWTSGSPPFLDMIVLTRLPSGRGPHQAKPNQLGADVMGEGLFSFGGGARLVSFITPAHAAFSSFIYEWRSMPIQSVERPSGDAMNLSAGYLYLMNFQWSVSVFANLRHVFRDHAFLDDNQGMTRLRSGANINYVILVPTWEISASLTTDPLFSRAGRNIPYSGVNAAITLKRSFL